MKRLGKMIGSQETYTKMSKILKDILNNMNNHYEDTDRLLEDAGYHQDQDFLKAEYKKHEQVMKHYKNIIKELKEFINTVDTDIDEFDTIKIYVKENIKPVNFVKVKLHNSNNNTQIIAKLPEPNIITRIELGSDKRTAIFVANDETFTFLRNAFENNHVISMYHEVFTDKEFKNMLITECKYYDGVIEVWFRCLE